MYVYALCTWMVSIEYCTHIQVNEETGINNNGIEVLAAYSFSLNYTQRIITDYVKNMIVHRIRYCCLISNQQLVRFDLHSKEKCEQFNLACVLTKY